MRLKNGFTQEFVAKKIGITFQQLQKYECGTNRVTVKRLADISAALGVSINSFLKNAETAPPLSGKSYGPMQKDLASLSGYYSKIKNRQVRKALLLIVKALANSEDQARLLVDE